MGRRLLQWGERRWRRQREEAAIGALQGARAWRGANSEQPFPCSAMEKGKLHKAAKDSSKRGRQVSGTWGLDKPQSYVAAARDEMGAGVGTGPTRGVTDV